MLHLAIFSGQIAAKDMTVFINTNAITKENIISIVLETGFWYLHYWTA